MIKNNRIWLLIIGGLLLMSVAAALLLGGSAAGGEAYIYQDGVLVRTIDLEDVQEPYSFVLTDKHGGVNRIEVERGRIRVADADCPDGVCVRQGWISTSAAPIACLPHGLIIEIAGGEEAVDAVIS